MSDPGPPLQATRLSNGSTSAARGTLDSFVQGALVDLFAAYSVALAPMPWSSAAHGPPPDVSVNALFTHGGSRSPCSLVLSLPQALLDHMKPGEATAVKMDWARELTGQFVGRIKNRLLAFGVRLELGALSVLERPMVEHHRTSATGKRLYAGRTLRGLVLATVQGLPDDSALSYTGTPSGTEGTLIWL
jgi:hypothetical protein